MKKIVMMLLVSCLPLIGQAQVAKCCMSYADYIADKWTPIDSLTKGRTLRVPQIKNEYGDYRIKTGDKQVDKILKKEVFAVKFGNQLYVNCRNLRQNDIIMDMQGYSQAYSYDGNKLCVAIYHIDDAAFWGSVGLDIASIFVDKPLSIGLSLASSGLWICKEKLSTHRCFLIDSDHDAKGHYEVTRMNDAFMEKILADDAHMYDRYMACTNKKVRQSASNVLPVLMEKGLIKE